MSLRDLKKKLRILRNWDFTCIVCGLGFEDIRSVTIEHLVPRSMGGKSMDNIAPSHYNCNRIRGVLSLHAASKLVAKKRQTLGEKNFEQWVNKWVPKRYVPEAFTKVSVKRPLRSFELPERLPGLST